MENVHIGSAPLGMNTVSVETSLPTGAVRDALNFDIDNSGKFISRPGARRLSTASGQHSLWSPRDRSYGLYAHDDQLKLLSVQGASLQSSVLLSGLTNTQRMKYYEYADTVFLTNGVELVVYANGVAKQIGLMQPASAPTVSNYPGAMFEGAYAVAYSYLSPTGEESALSPSAFVIVTDGGLSVEIPSIYPDNVASVRIYATLANGDVLYAVEDVPIGTLVARIQNDQRGKIAETQHLSRMIGGDDISASNGVLYVSNGKVLTYSEPLNYGLTNKKTNFVVFDSNILFHEPVADGLYVGTEDGTYFLSGTSPKDFTQRLVGIAPVVNDSIAVHATSVSTEPASDGLVAVWLGQHGFVLGHTGGQISSVQAKNMAIEGINDGVIVNFSVNGIRKIASIQEAIGAKGHESAKDSFI